MFTVNKRFKRSTVGILSLCLSQSVDANIWQSRFTQTIAFEQAKSEITAATSVNEAQDIAVTSINQALEAVENAQYFEPFSDTLENARNTLIQTRSRILSAGSQQQVNCQQQPKTDPLTPKNANLKLTHPKGKVIRLNALLI